MPNARNATQNRNSRSSALASNRKFGVEIEFVGISNRVALRALENAGLQIRDTITYNHQNSNTSWKVVTDASVHGDRGTGGEVVSPILSGDAGLEQVRTAAKALARAGATVNRTCGLHVHVDARNLTAYDVANTVTRYAHFERDIDAIMPRSRRERGNGYCNSIREWANRNRAALENPGSVRDLCRQFYERMSKLNLTAYLRHGTLEFRHHSGSVNAEKITNWIRFCVNFVEMSRVPGLRSQRRYQRTNTRRANKLEALVTSLRASGSYGATVHDLADDSGYSRASIPVMISKLRSHGFIVQKRRHRGTYVLVRSGVLPGARVDNPAPTAAVTTPGRNDSAFRGLSADVVSYYEERRAELAS